MKNEQYESRREQNEAFAREFCKDAKLKLKPMQMAMLRAALKAAAVCGAAEERSRILARLEDIGGLKVLYEQIIAQSVEEVLGYRAKAKRQKVT